MAVVRCSDVVVTYLEVIWDALGSGWSLLTCDHCLESVVNTGLTYFEKLLSSDEAKKYGKIGRFGATYPNNTSYSNQSLLSLKKSMSKLPLEFFLNLR